MIALLQKLRKNSSGAAALEAALVVPLLAGVCVLGSEAFMLGRAVTDMRAAVDAGAHLTMAGAKDAAAIRTAAYSEWQRRPADATLAVVRYCQCGTQVAACTPCNGATPPDIYYRLEARATHVAPVFGQVITHRQVVRVR